MISSRVENIINVETETAKVQLVNPRKVFAFLNM